MSMFLPPPPGAGGASTLSPGAPGMGVAGTSAGPLGGFFGGQPGDPGINLGIGGRLAMQGLGMVPGLGLPMAGLKLGLNAYNTHALDGQLQDAGLPGLDFGQAVGGVLGLNSYGDGGMHLPSGQFDPNSPGGNTSSVASSGPMAASDPRGSGGIGAAPGVAGGGIGRSNDGGGEYARGGLVTPNRMVGPNPRGPDQGYVSIQPGEFVMDRAAVSKFGPLLSAMNRGTLPFGLVPR